MPRRKRALDEANKSGRSFFVCWNKGEYHKRAYSTSYAVDFRDWAIYLSGLYTFVFTVFYLRYGLGFPELKLFLSYLFLGLLMHSMLEWLNSWKDKFYHFKHDAHLIERFPDHYWNYNKTVVNPYPSLGKRFFVKAFIGFIGSLSVLLF